MGLLAACIPACVWVVLKLGLDLSIDNVAFQHFKEDKSLSLSKYPTVIRGNGAPMEVN